VAAPNQTGNLKYDIDAENLQLSEIDKAAIVQELDNLAEIVAEFPIAVLHINFQHYHNSEETKCKLALVLPDRPFVTGDVGTHWQPVYEHCVRKMIKRVKHYKASLGNESELGHHRQNTDHAVVANRAPDTERIKGAVAKGDYEDFRVATYPYEEDIRSRIGRWVQRYPAIDAQIGTDLKIADIVEEVFLNAFARFENRPPNVRFGDWLEQLIDPSVKLIADHPDETQQEISFARTLREMDIVDE